MRYILALALALPATAADASFVSGLFNTGVNGTGAYGVGSLTADNASETHWSVSSQPLMTMPPTAYSNTTPVVIGDGPYPLRADGPWFRNEASFASKWIVPTRTQTPNVDQDDLGDLSHLNGTFTYSTTFFITQTAGELVTGVTLTGRYAVDDYMTEILLNNVVLAASTSTSGQFDTFRTFSLSSSAVVVGTNTLTFRTRNVGTMPTEDDLLRGNPSGFRVEFATSDLSIALAPPVSMPLPAGLPAGLLAAACLALPVRRRWVGRAA